MLCLANKILDSHGKHHQLFLSGKGKSQNFHVWSQFSNRRDCTWIDIQLVGMAPFCLRSWAYGNCPTISESKSFVNKK